MPMVLNLYLKESMKMNMVPSISHIMKNKNMEIKVVGNDSMEGMIEVKKFSGYEMLKVICEEEEGEGEMNKKRFKEEWEEVKVNKDLICPREILTAVSFPERLKL